MPQIGTIKLPDFSLLLAPMEDVSEPAFRTICKTNGADVLYSEFIGADNLLKGVARSQRKLQFFEAERPFGIQIFGGDELALARTAEICESVNPDFIDINFGCPVKNIVTKGAGAAVLKNVDLMVRLTKAVIKSTNLPVTVKTRLGWDSQSQNIEVVAQRMQAIGVQALAIHGRTRSQLYKGEADWELIGKVKNNPLIHIPIFGNGDIDSPQKAKLYKDRYGVDGIMIGRAAIGYPWIFREIKHYLATGQLLPAPTLQERIEVCKTHVTMSVAWKGNHVGITEMRNKYGQYLKGLPNFKTHRLQLVRLNTLPEICAALNNIAATEAGFVFAQTPIALVNYHEHCAL